MPSPAAESSDKKRKPVRNVGPLAKLRLPLRVSYRDTDQMGHVYYANYLVYFEMARGAMLRALGRSYADVERQGIFLPVLEAHAEYKASARYDDLIHIDSEITLWTRTRLDFQYRIRHADDQRLIAQGWTRHTFTNTDGAVSRQGHQILPGQQELAGRDIELQLPEHEL